MMQADIWSIGVIFYQMLFGQYPFERTNSYAQAYAEIKKFDIGQGPTYTRNNRTSSPKVTKFLREVLTMDTAQRLGWKEILNH